MHLQVWFEFASTYSYPAIMRVEEVAKQGGVEVSWYPFLLGPIFRSQGWDDSPFNVYPIKGRYMWRDLERVCAGSGLPFRRPSVFPRNGLLAARICAVSTGEAWLAAFIKAVYRSNFERDQDIADPEVVAHCLEQTGQVPEPLLALAAEARAKDALRRLTDEAISRGIFGAPTFVAGAELFWGNDRLEAAVDWCKRGEAAA